MSLASLRFGEGRKVAPTKPHQRDQVELLVDLALSEGFDRESGSVGSTCSSNSRALTMM
jgi:hypothetical protein